MKKSTEATGIRNAAMVVRLKREENRQFEFITAVTVTGTTTDGRTLIVNGRDQRSGDVYIDNSLSQAQAYIHDGRLKTFKVSVRFKRYYKIGPNWYIDDERTVDSSVFTY